MLNAFVTLSPLATTNKFAVIREFMHPGRNVEEETRTSAGEFRSVHQEQIPQERGSMNF
jgi:hypothetical protein